METGQVAPPLSTSTQTAEPTVAGCEIDHVFVVLGYGESPFLEGCIDSLLKQTVRSRIIIATSTPSDFILEIAKGAGVEVVVNPVRAGIAEDWNFALDLAKARFVTLAHQDDTYHRDFLAHTMASFSKEEGVICFTGYQEIDDAGARRSSRISLVKHLLDLVILFRATRIQGRRLRLYLSFGNPLPCPSVTYNMAKLEGFTFASEFASNLDWDAWWRLMAAGAVFLRIPARLVGRRHNELTETSRLLRNGARSKEDRIMFARAWPRPASRLIAWVYRLAG